MLVVLLLLLGICTFFTLEIFSRLGRFCLLVEGEAEVEVELEVDVVSLVDA